MNDSASLDLLTRHGGQRFPTILADPPWQFQNRTGKMAAEKADRLDEGWSERALAEENSND